MGICPISKTFRVVPTDISLDPLVSLRTMLILKLRKLHNLDIKCKKIIENLILDNQGDIAVQVKAKQLQLKEFASILQVIIEKLDNFNENSKSSLQKTRFMQDVTNEINEKEKILNFDQLELILNQQKGTKDLSTLDGLMKVQTEDLEKELKGKLKVEVETLEKLNKGSDFQRRRYLKENY